MLTHKQRAGKRKARIKQEQEKNNSIAAGWRLVCATINDSVVIAAAALHDEFGFGEARTKRFLDKFTDLFETCIQGGDMLDVGSIEEVLKEEGIKCIDSHKYDFMRIDKQ